MSCQPEIDAADAGPGSHAPPASGGTAAAAAGRRWPARPEDAVELAAGRAQEARPAGPAAQPGHVRGRGRLGADHVLGHHPPLDLRLDDHRLAVADRAVRQPGRGGGRGPGQGPGRDAAPDQEGDRGPAPGRLDAGPGRPARGGGARHPAHPGRLRAGRGRAADPRRRRRGRGRGLGGRVGHHRRVRPGHPRVRRRPVRGHRRDPGAVRPDRGEDHLQAGRDVHRPDDRPGRGRRRGRRRRTRWR